MARKKVVFVIVEGPSDDAALGVILNRLFDKSKVHIEIIHGDITTDLNIDPVDIASALGKIVKDYAESMHFSQVHFQQVIHLVDMDGAFIPDTSIVENPDADNPIYSLTEIQTARPEQMAKRNEHKQRVLNRISKLKKVWASIPYQVYYMSCNLDHVLHGKLNSSDEEKENDAYSFAKKYKDDIDGFLAFISDSDFSRMPAVVMEGRRVVNNIERTASLFLVKNIFSMLLSIFSVCMVLEYPLEPAQISLISMFTIGIPGFIMSLEPNKERIRGRFLSKVILKALPAGLTDFLVVSAMVIFCREFAVNAADVSTACTVIVAIVGFMILYRIASPMTKAHWIMLTGVITGWLFCVVEISHLFAINSISKQCAMLLIVFAMLTEPLLRYLSLLIEKANALYRRLYAKWRKSHIKE